MAVPLDEFVEAHRHCSPEEFQRRIRDPHLLVVRAPTANTPDRADFSTLLLRAAPGRLNDRPVLLPVQKRPGGNPFGMMITIGRAANNDIVLNAPGVSKLQCYLHQFTGTWAVCDPGSTNGTFVDGARVRTTGTPLRSGARLALADVFEVVFLEPRDLYALVQGGRSPGLARSPDACAS